MSDKQSNDSRRKLLKSAAVGAGVVVTGKSMPESWTKPVVNAVMLPAHAETTDGSGTLPGQPTTTPVPCTEPELLRIVFQFPYNGSNGSANQITSVTFLTDQDGSPTGNPDATYVTAWGYFAGSSAPVYINTDVIWSSSNTMVAHTGSSSSVVGQQASSSITTYGVVSSAVISASYIDLCRNTTVTGSYTVNVDVK